MTRTKSYEPIECGKVPLRRAVVDISPFGITDSSGSNASWVLLGPWLCDLYNLAFIFFLQTFSLVCPVTVFGTWGARSGRRRSGLLGKLNYILRGTYRHLWRPRSCSQGRF